MKVLTLYVLPAIFGAVLAWMTFARPAAAQTGFVGGMVYELRTYTTLPGRLPALNKRFRSYTLKFFEKYGMKNVVYLIPQDKDNTLIYLLAHQSREAADAAWKSFQADPEWKKVKEESEADGKIVDKVETMYLNPTDYSPMK